MADDLPRGRVSITSTNPEFGIRAHLIGKPEATPAPRYDTQDRPGRTGHVRYVGHDPVEQTFTIKFDGTDDRESVEDRVRTVERFLRRTARTGEPPIARVKGDGILYPDLDWRVRSIVEDKERRKYVIHTGDRMVYVALVTLVEQAADRQLAESLDALNGRGRGRGITNRKTRVRDGEDSLHDVARRVYDDPSRASDIARANPRRRLGERLRPGIELRLP